MGLFLSIERKSVKSMAARLAPANVRAMHQSLHHVVAVAPWSDRHLLTAVRDYVLPAMTKNEPLLGWIVDDTAFPKKGAHSVGVIRQYCGQLGKQKNCRIAVSLSVVTEHASLPVAYQLYLPEQWAEDPRRREETGVPAVVKFQTKAQIALEQMRDMLFAGVPRAPVLADDAAYGNDDGFRASLEQLQLQYVVGVESSMTVWPPATGPLGLNLSGGRRAASLRRHEECSPLSVKELALYLAAEDFFGVSWSEGRMGTRRSRFAALRVRPAHRVIWRKSMDEEQWLLIERPKTESEPTKYWLSNLPAHMTLREMVLLTKLRWRLERDYKELNQELGLGHNEGRGWRGFHHHATLCIAAYGFLVAERSRGRG
jgi:SRSO17 transposase